MDVNESLRLNWEEESSSSLVDQSNIIRWSDTNFAQCFIYNSLSSTSSFYRILWRRRACLQNSKWYHQLCLAWVLPLLILTPAVGDMEYLHAFDRWEPRRLTLQLWATPDGLTDALYQGRLGRCDDHITGRLHSMEPYLSSQQLH